MNPIGEEITFRHPRREDAPAIVEMVALCDIEDHGVPDITLEDLLHMWHAIQIESDAWIACAPAGEMVGYAFVERRGETRIDTCVFVHPSHKKRGIGSALLSIAEERAAQLAAGSTVPQQLMNQLPFTNEAARALVEARGYTFSRLYQRMKIVLSEAPQEARFPEGLTARPFQTGKDETALYTAYDESFRDSWGYAPVPFAEWIDQQKGERYDPSLWSIVWDGDQPAAFWMGKLQEDGLFIDLLGVRRPWRKQGIGLAMLHHAFQTAWERGERTIMLNVDSHSLTNAQELYARAGMHPSFQIALYRKELTRGT